MTDTAKSDRRARHEAILAQVADEEIEASEAEVAANAATASDSRRDRRSAP